MMMAVAAGALDTVLLMSGRSVASLVNGVVAAVVNVGLCLVLIPWVGMVGAAIAWAAAVVVRNGLAYGQVRQDLGVTPWSAGAALVAVSVACCYVAPLATLTVTDVLTPATGLVAGIVGTVLYAAFLWWGRTLLALDVLLSVLPRRVRHRLDGP